MHQGTTPIQLSRLHWTKPVRSQMVSAIVYELYWRVSALEKIRREAGLARSARSLSGRLHSTAMTHPHEPCKPSRNNQMVSVYGND